MFRRPLSIFAATAMVAVIAGCAQPSSAGSDPEAQLAASKQSLEGNLYVQAVEQSGSGSNTCPATVGADEPVEIVFSIEGMSHPFLTAQVKAAEEAAAAAGATLTVQSGDDDVSAQLSGLETALSQGPDALLLMPAKTEGLQPVLTSYEDAGIPYAFTGKGMEGVNPVLQYLAPYGAEGTLMGQYVVDQFSDREEPVKVAVITGITGDLSSVARSETFKQELLEAGNFEIVAEQAGEYRRQPSQDAMDAILAANPNIDLVFAASDEGALGAIDSIQAAGLGDQIDVVGLDGAPEMYQAIQDGNALATVDHLPSAGDATTLLVSCLRGESIPSYKVNVGTLVDLDAIENGKQPEW